MEKILFSAFDAGGGNAIFPVVSQITKSKKYKILCLIGGPSKAIFSAGGGSSFGGKNQKIKYIDVETLRENELITLIKDYKPDFFISGTSSGLTFDKKILPIARRLGARTIYILDYWANYWQRFSGEKKDFKYLPDIICVMDNKAKKEMLAEGFNSKSIKVTGNPYFDFFQKNIKSGREENSTILFLSQPYAGKRDQFGYDEFEVLDGILEMLGNLKADFRVIIRPHPKEEIGKFDTYIKKNILVNTQTSIEKLLSRAGLIIGMNTMVLFQATIAGKKVISYQPNLKTKDFSVSGEFGLGKLATNKKDLQTLLKKYLHNKFPMPKKNRNIILPHATKNIINVIKKRNTYEENK